LNYHILDYHIPLLESIDVVDSGCISVLTCTGANMYYSAKYLATLGWDSKRAETDMEYTNSLIHLKICRYCLRREFIISEWDFRLFKTRAGL
jgi:hypothetical protein